MHIVVNIIGTNGVQIERQGGSTAGGCTYIGTIRVSFAGGTYSCNGQPVNGAPTIFAQ